MKGNTVSFATEVSAPNPYTKMPDVYTWEGGYNPGMDVEHVSPCPGEAELCWSTTRFETKIPPIMPPKYVRRKVYEDFIDVLEDVTRLPSYMTFLL